MLSLFFPNENTFVKGGITINSSHSKKKKKKKKTAQLRERSITLHLLHAAFSWSLREKHLSGRTHAVSLKDLKEICLVCMRWHISLSSTEQLVIQYEPLQLRLKLKSRNARRAESILRFQSTLLLLRRKM